MAAARWVFSTGLATALVAGVVLTVLRADDVKPAGPVVQGTTVQYSAVASPAMVIKAVPAGPGGNPSVPGPNGPNGPNGAAGAMPGKPDGGPGESSDKPDDAKAKDALKPIHRPPAPATSPSPKEFKVRPDQAGKIRLCFNDQPWQPVLEWLATISGMSLDWQELPGDSLNLTTQRSYTVPEVRDLINRLLLDRGFTLLCHGEVLTVAEVKKIDPSLVPRIALADLPSRLPHEFVKVSFPLVSLLAETAAEDLKPMCSPNGRLTALSELNRLEAMDAVANLRDIDAVLRQQAEESQPRSVREFKLKHARAAEVHRLLTTLLGADSPTGPAGAGGNPQQAMMAAQQEQAMQMARMQAGNQPGGPQPPGSNSASKKTAVSLAVNERNNSIWVQARPDKMLVIAQIVEAVDIPVNRDDTLLVNLNRMQVYRLTGIDPDPVVKTLMEIGNLEPSTRLEIDRKNSAIVAYASLVDHVTIRAVIDKLTGSERKFEVIHLRRLAADYVAGTIDFMMGGAKKEKSRPNPFFGGFDSSGRDDSDKSKSFHVDADVENNRLLLWANPVELGEVQTLLVKLGEIRATGEAAGNLRVIDGGDAKETQELIERIRHAWPTVAPNALLAPAAVSPSPLDGNKEPTRPLPAVPKDSSTSSPIPGPSPSKAASQAPAALFHLADIRRTAAESTAADSSSANGSSANSSPANASPANSSPAQQGADKDQSAPPVKIVVGPDGKMIISSKDAQALDRFEELAAQLATPHKDFHVFHLRYAWAVGVALNLEDFFKDDNKKERPRYSPWWYDGGMQNDSQDERRLSKRRKLTFISDADSNTILVEGASSEQLRTIDELIQLYDQPPPTDTQSVRKTEIIRLKYSKAKAVADTVKDVYRDLLSANDKALAENKGRDSGRNYIFNYSDSDNTEQKTPKFKGLLSIGVDEVSNSLMVSAPAYLFDHVAKMIRELDQAAVQDYTVRMVHVHRGMSADRMKDILNEVYMQKSAEKSSGQERSAGKSEKNGRNGKSSKSGAHGNGNGDKESANKEKEEKE